MSRDHIQAHICNALDLIQIIVEDMEENFLTSTDSAIKARATMTISALYILTDYLRSVREGVTEHEDQA